VVKVNVVKTDLDRALGIPRGSSLKKENK